MHRRLAGTTVPKSAVVGVLLHKGDQVDFDGSRLFSSSALQLPSNRLATSPSLCAVGKVDGAFRTLGTKFETR